MSKLLRLFIAAIAVFVAQTEAQLNESDGPTDQPIFSTDFESSGSTISGDEYFVIGDGNIITVSFDESLQEETTYSNTLQVSDFDNTVNENENTTPESNQYMTTIAPSQNTPTTEQHQNTTGGLPQNTSTEQHQNTTGGLPQNTSTEPHQNTTRWPSQNTSAEPFQNTTTESRENTTTESSQNTTTSEISQSSSTTGRSQNPTTPESHQNTTTNEISQSSSTTGRSQNTTTPESRQNTTTNEISQSSSTTGISQNPTTPASRQNTTTNEISQSSSTTGRSQNPTTPESRQDTTTIGTTLRVTSSSGGDKKQRDLYPWGDVANDHIIKQDTDSYTYNYESRPIYFAGGVPFGSDKFTVAHVLSNGAITFGTKYWAWWPNLNDYYQQSILAPFWFDHNYQQPGNVYYHLYESKDSGKSSSRKKQVLDRASNEVNEFYGDQHFKAQVVLVATWEKVEPYSWYAWLCEYYHNYHNTWWWHDYYSSYYQKYCTNQIKETNTFQAVYATDGQEAHVIVTYKFGEMKWKYEMWRNIVVGVVTSDTIIDYGVTYTDLTTKMDNIKWNTGRFGTWIEKVGQIENPDSRCLNFYTQNLYLISDSTHQQFAAALFDCPCSLERMGMQWWSYSYDHVPGTERTYRVCYAIGVTAKVRLEKLKGNPLNKLCCYLLTYPQSWYWEDWKDALSKAFYIHFYDTKAGHLLLNDPWYWWGNARKSREEDFNPHKWCCESSSSPSELCGYFNIVRPDYGCSPEAEFITGVALGDPHIKTLDNKDYTLNGLGEYILLSIAEVEFMLQGRTQQVLNSEGNKTSATVFVAFAAREESNFTFQVELDSPQTGLVISACGIDITRDFNQDANFNDTQCDDNIDVLRRDRNGSISVIVSFPCGVSIEVFVGLKNLEFSTNVPRMFQGNTRGLLGNLNGDPNDDFILPDGTILTANDTDTERKIFYKFGKEWEVNTQNSIFTYQEGESALDYQFPEFEPIFIEEVNRTVLSEAIQFCREENAACIFDYIVTRDKKFASNTNNNNKEANKVKTSQVNNLPVLSLAPNQLNSNLKWEVTHGQQASINFHASDADADDDISYMLKGNSNNVFINGSGVLTYTPNSTNSVVIGVQAQDSKGGLSSVIFLNIVVCPSCGGHGVCNKNRTREKEQEEGKFVLYVCNCSPAYTGEDCEKEVDACASSPCSRNQTCTDLSAAVQGNNETGYVCGACPNGFTKLNAVCADINECIVNGTGSVCPKNAMCTNSVGSYLCTCDLGFRQDPVNNSYCKDVDECTERTHKCDQICQNEEGSYSCSCFDGNTLNGDGKTCTPVNSAACAKCKQACILTNGAASCGCRTGYQLSGTTECVDIDECAAANKPCSQACLNTEGSFVCSCYYGYKLAEDGVSCTACDRPYYGENCASMCICNGRGSCNHISGCQCRQEWTGLNCNEDKNECTTNISACPGGQICTNTFGSYSCSCPQGYILSNGKCEDINECGDVLDHNCSLSVEDCINNKGSYNCRCRLGYARNGDGVCEDIDECAKNVHECEQMCENTPGGYNCKCYYGYKLDINRANCVKRETDVCAGVTNLACDHVCTVDLATHTPYCKCNSGYSLSLREKCLEIDECRFDHLNLCEYKEGCTNTVGGYSCSCLSGSVIDNDGRSCVVCSGGKWGMNCTKDCACSPGASYCDPKRGCVCKSGYTGVYCEQDIDECSTGILTCKIGEQCVNKPGSATCDCLLGYTKIGTSCQDIDECASVSTNDCDQVCDNYAGGYSCSCNVGYLFNLSGRICQDIDECALKLGGCEQICENSNGGYRCSCSDGLKLLLDGVSCVVVSQCVNKKCDEKCAVVHGKETCFCSKGKVLDSTDNSTCLDVDMCANNRCTYPNNCTETSDGASFVCSCPDGQKLASDGFTCVNCTEGTFGRNCAQKCTCNMLTTQSCGKTDGVCSCKPGWSSSTCSEDVDECHLNASCPVFSECVDTPGSYVCKCLKGYHYDLISKNCQQCPANTYGEECRNQCTCDTSHGTCDSVSGNCVCQVGWTGVNCDTDVDECSEGYKCDTTSVEHWGCLNTVGNYTCGCLPGYVLDTSSSNCVDFDECASDFSNECDQNCTNTAKSYLCSCNKGYQLGSDGHRCDDIDECSQDSYTCQQVCNNQVGGYSCSCHEGYQLRADNASLCYEALKVQSEVTLLVYVTELNLREPLSRDFLIIKAVVENALKDEITKTVNGVTSVSVTHMRKGSLIVDVTTIIDKTANPNAASDMVEAIMLLLQNGVTINGTHHCVAVKVGNMIVNSTTDRCIILETIEPCTDGAQCFKNAAGKVSCKKQSDEDSVDVPLVVGLSVGLPLGVALILAVVAAVWYKKKFQTQKRIHNREDFYSGKDHTPSPEVLHNFYAVPHDTEKATSKASDKQNLVQ